MDGSATISETVQRVTIGDRENTVVLIGPDDGLRVTRDEAVVEVGEGLRFLSVGTQGPPGASSNQEAQYDASGAVSGHRVVALDGNVVRYADHSVLGDAALVLGLSLNAAADGDPVVVRLLGPVTEAGWSWTPELPVYLGASGHLTQVPPSAPSAVFSLVVGQAVAADTIIVRVESPILL